MLEALIPLLHQLDQLHVSHLRLKCLLSPENPAQINPALGGDRQFRKLILHLKSNLPHMGLILESPYPHIQSKIPLCYTPKEGFFFQARTHILPVHLRYYMDILISIREKAQDSQLMPHEISQFKKLIEIFELAFIKTKKPHLELFTNLSLWFSASPVRRKLIKNYLINLPQDHYNAFFPKSKLDEWHLREPSLITLY